MGRPPFLCSTRYYITRRNVCVRLCIYDMNQKLLLMKRSVFVLFIASLMVVFSCERLGVSSTVVSYRGEVEQTKAIEGELYNLTIVIAVQNNDFCSIYTGMTSSNETGKVLISNERVRTGCRIIYGENGFIIIDGTSGKQIAKGENLEETQWQREIVLDWDEPICEEWVLYAEKYGWEKPCRMRVNVNLYDDIVDY